MGEGGNGGAEELPRDSTSRSFERTGMDFLSFP